MHLDGLEPPTYSSADGRSLPEAGARFSSSLRAAVIAAD
jgi:hypothetical protein